MPLNLDLMTDSFPIAGGFTISRGVKTHADVITVTLRDGEFIGTGECVPYKRYDESLQSVENEILAAKEQITAGITTTELQSIMKAGAARNAVDCALWDLEAKRSGVPVYKTIGISAPHALTTAFTISLGDLNKMIDDVTANAQRPLLKIKLGTANDIERIIGVRNAAPNAKIIIDANEGWTADNIEHHLAVAAEMKIDLIEQPLPAGNDSILSVINRPVAICADESVHLTKDLESLRDRYDAINIKLDKTGGLTEALVMKAEAQRLGYKIMVGCMVGSSLAMAPAVLLAQDVDFVDLDGPLLLARDRTPCLKYSGSIVSPPESKLWG